MSRRTRWALAVTAVMLGAMAWLVLGRGADRAWIGVGLIALLVVLGVLQEVLLHYRSPRDG